MNHKPYMDDYLCAVYEGEWEGGAFSGHEKSRKLVGYISQVEAQELLKHDSNDHNIWLRCEDCESVSYPFEGGAE